MKIENAAIPQTDHAKPLEEKDKNELIYLMFSFMWTGTAGAVIAEALNTRIFWPMHVSPILLPINWIIFPFKPQEGCVDNQKTIYRITCFVAGGCFGFTTYLINEFIPILNQIPYSTSIKVILYCTQVGFLGVNLISSYGLNRLTAPSKRINCMTIGKNLLSCIAKGVRGIFNNLTGRGSPHSSIENELSQEEELDPESVKRNILKQIEIMKKQNEIDASKIEQIKNFIENDSSLNDSFRDCLEKTKDILLPPPKKDNFNPLNNALAEEYRQEMQRMNYLQSLKTRFKDFLEKNPDFCTALEKKLKT